MVFYGKSRNGKYRSKGGQSGNTTATANPNYLIIAPPAPPPEVVNEGQIQGQVGVEQAMRALTLAPPSSIVQVETVGNKIVKEEDVPVVAPLTLKRAHDHDDLQGQGDDEEDEVVIKKRRKITTAKIEYILEGDEGVKDPLQNLTYFVPAEDVEGKGLTLVDPEVKFKGENVNAVKVTAPTTHQELVKDFTGLAEDRIYSHFGQYQLLSLEQLEAFARGKLIAEGVKDPFPFDEESLAKLMSDPSMMQLLGARNDKVNNIVVAKASYGTNQGEVKISDLKHLKPETFLNDALIDYGMICTLNKVGVNPSEVALLSSLTFSMLMKPLDEPFPESLSRSLYRSLSRQSEDLLNIKYIVLPIGRETHWFLAVICNPFPDAKEVAIMEEKIAKARAMSEDVDVREYVRALYKGWMDKYPSIMIMDSVSEKMFREIANYNDFVVDTAAYVERALLALHDKYWIETGRPDFVQHEQYSDYNIRVYSLHPVQQPNKFDCGFFVMENSRLFFEQLKAFQGNYMALRMVDFTYRSNPVGVCWMRTRMECHIVRQCQQLVPEMANEVKRILIEQKKMQLKMTSNK